MGAYYSISGSIPVKLGLAKDEVDKKIKEMLGEDFELFAGGDCEFYDKDINGQPITPNIYFCFQAPASYGTIEDVDAHAAALCKEFLPPDTAAEFTCSGDDFDDGPAAFYVGSHCAVLRKKLEAIDDKIKDLQTERAKITHELNLDAKNEFVSEL